MKKIVKSKEPTSLTTYRGSISKADLAKFEKFDTAPTDVKNDLRNYLLEEQGFICCYCMNRIQFRNSKIEHFKPRSLFRVEQLDYNNLFVACLGGQGNSPSSQTCDTKKDNDILENIYLLRNIEKDIEYKKDGFIFSENSHIDIEINEILNLNYKILQNNRKQALVELRSNLKDWKIPTLKFNLNKYQNKNSKGKYRPYCQMIVYFLTKKLKQKGITA